MGFPSPENETKGIYTCVQIKDPVDSYLRRLALLYF